MRLWTLHPQYLDGQGLVALWREGLLAQQVLRGLTRGYRNHPQLKRFRGQDHPLAAMASYLIAVLEEATRRGYHFDAAKIGPERFCGTIVETEGQLLAEWSHLLTKFRRRSPDCIASLRDVIRPIAHPLFAIVPGEIRDWEKSARSICSPEGFKTTPAPSSRR